ncbi:MAG: mechanosensitive ion channel family protein [Candidatus Hydrogenedentota bacterium]
MDIWRILSRSLGAFLLVGAVMLASSALAQEADAPAEAEQTEEGAEEPLPEPERPEFNLTHPRATVRTFLDAMNAVEAGEPARIADAMACFHITEEQPEAMAATCARQLFEILDELTIDLQAIPDDPDVSQFEWTLPQDVTLILHRYEDERYRFNSATVEAIPEFHERIVEEEAPPEPVAPPPAPEPEDPATPAAPTEGAEPVQPAIDPDLETPRATMRTFLEGMRDWDDDGREQAVKTLDMTGVTVVNQEEAAFLLRDVLARFGEIVPQEIPNRREGAPYEHELRHPDLEEVFGVVTIAPTMDEQWQFSAETIANLRELHASVEHFPILDNTYERHMPLSLRVRNWVANSAPFLLQRALYLENWQWLGLVSIIVVGTLISRGLTWVLSLGLRRWYSRSELTLEPELEKPFIRPVRVAIMAWAWFLGLSILGLPDNILGTLEGAAKLVTVLAVVWAFYRLVDIVGNFVTERAAKNERRFDDLLAPLITRGLKILALVYGVVIVSELFELTLTSLLAGLGLGGLALALAAQSTVSNIFGSITVLFDRPFQIGDWVKINDVEGIVEVVGMRSTRVRTFYNSLVTIPNADMITATVDNMGARRYRRTYTTLSLTYSTSPEKIEAFCEGIREIIRLHPYTRKDFFEVRFTEFGDDALKIMLYVFHQVPDWSSELRERHRLFIDIIRLAQRVGVEFAFPTQTLYLHRGQEGGIPLAKGPYPKTLQEAFIWGQREAENVISGVAPEEDEESGS